MVDLPYSVILVTKDTSSLTKDKWEKQAQFDSEETIPVLPNNTLQNSSNVLDLGPKHVHPGNFYYHRLDLLPPENGLCRHFRQPATLGTGTIYLYPSSFKECSWEVESAFSKKDVKDLNVFLAESTFNFPATFFKRRRI